METFSALLALCVGNSSVTCEFPSQRPVMQSFDVFFDLHLNKRSRKQSRRRWLEARSRSWWRHRNSYHLLGTKRINSNGLSYFRCDMASIEPMHRNKAHITYLPGLLTCRILCTKPLSEPILLACRLLGTKLYTEPILTYCQLYPWKQTSVAFTAKLNDFFN